jgi:hypothetical protein
MKAKRKIQKKTNTAGVIFLWTIIIVAILGISAAVFYFYKANEKVETGFVPSEEFRPTYEAMIKEIDNSDNALKVKEFGIEETIRIINGLEKAQFEYENFNDFLRHMAKQDYSRVPDDVIAVKIKLLPILQKMFQMQKEHKEMNFWKITKNAALNFLTDSESTDKFTNNVSNLTTSLLGGGFLDPAAVIEVVREPLKKIAEGYKEKGKLKKEIDRIVEEYTGYLSEYYPVYNKYMKEWNQLCLMKDKAYLDVYSGRMIDAYNTTTTILEKYPDNRETLLLSALSSIYIAPQFGKSVKEQPRLSKIIPENEISIDFNNNTPSGFEINNDSIQNPVDITDNTSPTDNDSDNESIDPNKYLIPHSKITEIQTEDWNPYYLEADMILDRYMERYPDYSAPALVLKGLLYQQLGINQQALSYFDQAAIEYPKQAEHLKDLLDAYCYRTYLNKSQEGLYLLKLYRSTMEGYGMFSPNFQKSLYYLKNNEKDKSQEEIYKHFFRRGNQGIYDCLLTDMEFCEKALYPSFKSMLLEQSFIDLNIEQTGFFFKNDDQIRIKINNRSDIPLENVRVFLCIHYTDMYTDEYDIVKVPTSKNKILHEENADIGTLKLEYNGKKFNDIVKVRAIVMTDDKVCWIDNINQRIGDLKPRYNFEEIDVNNILDGLRNIFLKELALDALNIKKLLLTKESENWVKNLDSDKKFVIELPRELALVSPLFSINEIKDKETAIRPERCILSGQSIKMRFNYRPKEGEIVPLYIYSDSFTLKVNILYKKEKSEIQDIEII